MLDSYHGDWSSLYSQKRLIIEESKMNEEEFIQRRLKIYKRKRDIIKASVNVMKEKYELLRQAQEEGLDVFKLQRLAFLKAIELGYIKWREKA
jgi:hypothetical protein